MITEEQLREALDAIASSMPIPPSGRTTVVEAAFDTARSETSPGAAVGPARAHRRVNRRWIAYGGAFATAAAIVLIALATTGGRPPVEHRIAAPSPGRFAPATATSGSARVAGGISGAQGSAAAVKGPVVSPLKSTTAPTGGVPARVVSTGTLRLGVTRDALEHDVTALRSLASGVGGYISSTDVTERGGHGGGTLDLAVPASTFASVIAGAEKLGTTDSLVTKADDVTKAYTDTAAQIRALTDVRAQLEALLAKTGTVADLLEVEQQIESVQSQIDILESEQSTLTQEVTYARLTVDLVVSHPAPPKPAPQSAFGRAWSKAISGFTGSVRWLISISGVVVFILLLGAALIVIARLCIRRLLPRLRRYFL